MGRLLEVFRSPIVNGQPDTNQRTLVGRLNDEFQLEFGDKQTIEAMMGEALDHVRKWHENPLTQNIEMTMVFVLLIGRAYELAEQVVDATLAGPRPIDYTTDQQGRIVLPSGPPFDGQPVLIELAEGWVEAYLTPAWRTESEGVATVAGWCWTCLGSNYEDQPLESALRWLAKPREAPVFECELTEG